MTGYKKLVEALRCKSLSKQCDSCKYGYRLCPDSECNDACHVEQIYADAAAAIEALQAEEKSRKENCEKCSDATRRVITDLQGIIADLRADLPKRGEWKTTDAFPHRVYCSNCFRTYVPNDRWQIWVDKPGEGGLERNYCPSCGAKMEVQE